MNPRDERRVEREALQSLVELVEVSRRYTDGGSTHVVLDRISTVFRRGEFTAIVGRSGSGKSTLLHLLGALDLPDSGRILFDGQDLTALAESGRALLRRRRIGFVFQSFNLIPTLTVLENLLVPLELNSVPRPLALDRGHRLLSRIGLDRAARRYPESLSGGEQQRLAVVRAIAHEPELVIADEPTGNLDLDTAREVLDLLERFCTGEGRALIMATHSPEVTGRAARVLQLRRGILT